MDVVAALPLLDGVGNALVGFRSSTQPGLAGLDGRIPMPLALSVVTFADRVLMVLDSWRRQWELPGGMVEPGETAWHAAVRELKEGSRTVRSLSLGNRS